MKSFSSPTAHCAVALAAAAALCSSMPAAAAQVTWYVTGHMQPALAGTPADLMALAPAGAAFSASFSFDADSASHPIYFTSSRTDFVTNSALGASALDVSGNHFASSASSRIIEQADFNGESVTLNGGAVSGPVPGHYQFGALDVLTVSHSGPGSAPQSEKYPWFSPFGPSGTFLMISAAQPVDITLSDRPATMDLFFYEPTLSAYYHRIGTVEAISTSPVPEPTGWALLLAGVAAVGLTVQRRRGQAG